MTSRTRAAGCACARAPTRSRSRWPSRPRGDVDQTYVRCLKILMAGDGLPDGGQPRPAADRDRRGARRAPRPRRRSYEFQMLYGIRPEEQKRIADRGRPDAGLHPLRRGVVRLPHAPDGRAPGQPMFFLRGRRHRRRVAPASHDDRHGNCRDLRCGRHGRDAALRADPRRAAAPTTSSSPAARPDRADDARRAVRRAGAVQRRGRRRRPTPSCSWSSRRTWARSLEEISDHVSPGNLVVSLAAGITDRVPRVAAARGRRRRPGHAQHPGPRRPGHGRRSAPGAHAPTTHLAEAEALLRSCGRVVQVAEKHQDAVTAICGSGPGLHLLRRRGDDRGRRRARPARGRPPPSSSSRRCSVRRR